MDDEKIENLTEEDLIPPRVKVFKPTDESLKLLGELLRNDTSRKIIKKLGEEELYVNKLAEKLDIRISLVIHHLQKIIDLGLVDIVEKPITRKTKNHKFYKINTDTFLSFTEDKGGKLKRIFKEGVKFASIGIIAFIAWIFEQRERSTSEFSHFLQDEKIPKTDEINHLIIPLIVVIVGLSILLIREKTRSHH